jgi:hypothetical protein
MKIDVADDLAVAIGDRSVHVSPSEAFALAERLIRCATTRMIVEETDRCSSESSSSASSRSRC